jgi:serine protease Do/serine protease DegQ
VIITANGQAIKDSHDIRNIVGLLQVGDNVDIEYLRGNQKKTTTATISKPELAKLAGEKLHRTLKGTILTATQKDQIEGVVFSSISNNSYPWKVGLRSGDVIVSANRYRVRNLDELKQAVNPTAPLLINIQRGDEGLFVVLQ